jgi:hypothetical protein
MLMHYYPITEVLIVDGAYHKRYNQEVFPTSKNTLSAKES